MKTSSLILISGLLLLSACNNKEQSNPAITTTELRDHVTFLASDELKGRYPGTPGSKEAADYIRDQFTEGGLDLKVLSGFQPFDVTTGQKAEDSNLLQFDGFTGELGEDFTPMPFSGNDEVKDSVVFVGYGLKADARGFTWNDYQKENVEGRWVMIIRGAPEDQEIKKHFMGRTKDREKASTAMEEGAAGILFVSGRDPDSGDDLVNPRVKSGNLSLPVFHITRTTANRMLAGQTLEELEERINETRRPVTFPLKVEVHGKSELNPVQVTARNVVGGIRAGHPNPTGGYIVIGAHYDHLGMGGDATGSRSPDTTAVHNGADDNASGVAAMLEIAEKLASKRDSLKQHILFVGFDAEELGLIGSRSFVRQCPVPVDSIHAMINLDMIGRLPDENNLRIGGTGTAVESEQILRELNEPQRFSLGMMPEGYGPSDHSSFYSQDIPVFFFSTGPHLDYHTPKDDAEDLNYPGLKKVADFACDLAWDLANRHETLAFQKAGPKSGEEQRKHRADLKATLGIMPDFSGIEERGLRAELVIEGKPADRAGMENGDVITAINGQRIKDIYDYMNRLSDFEPGDNITVEVIRDETKKVMLVKL